MVERLPADCKRVLYVAAVIGHGFETAFLQCVCDIPPERLIELLETAVDLGIVVEDPSRSGRYGFSDALVRDALYGNLRPLVRLSLHRQVGEALERVRGSDPEPHLPQLAYHFLEAAPLGEADKAIDYATRAARRAMERLDSAEAVDYYERALRVVELWRSRSHARRHELLLELAEARSRAAESDAREERHEPRAGDPAASSPKVR